MAKRIELTVADLITDIVDSRGNFSQTFAPLAAEKEVVTLKFICAMLPHLLYLSSRSGEQLCAIRSVRAYQLGLSTYTKEEITYYAQLLINTGEEVLNEFRTSDE